MPRQKRKYLDKCDYCNAIGYDCRESRCEVEYAKYIIMLNALVDWLSNTIDVTVYLDSAFGRDAVRTASKELRALKRDGRLLEYLMTRVIPYIVVSEDSTP